MRMIAMETITLNNGVEMPALGLGVFQTTPGRDACCGPAALDTGYHLIDTAAAYGNEPGRGCGAQRVDEPVRGLSGDEDLDQRLRVRRNASWLREERPQAWRRPDRPADSPSGPPSAFDRTLEAYRALETLLSDGKVRAIGVGGDTRTFLPLSSYVTAEDDSCGRDSR